MQEASFVWEISLVDAFTEGSRLVEIREFRLDDAQDGGVEALFGDFAASHSLQDAVVDGGLVRVVVADENEVGTCEDRFGACAVEAVVA